MKKITAYLRNEKVILHASSRTTAGVWILDAPVLEAPSLDPAGLGQLVVETLEGSRQVVPHPVVWKGIFDPVLRLAGVRTPNTFAKTARCVEVESDSGLVTFIPTVNHGSKGGYEPRLQKSRQVSTVNPIDIGYALLASFQECA